MSLSLLHEAPRLLLEERPELLFELLGTPPPEEARLALASGDVTQAVPLEGRADAVLTVRREDSVVGAYIVETQLAIDPEKLFSWPLYTAAIHARHRCPTTLVVITPSARVAAWARRENRTFQPGLGFRPHVLGPNEVSLGVRHDGSSSPELAVLRAVLAPRGRRRDEALAAALLALRRVDEVRAASYLHLLSTTLGVSLRDLGESAMPASPETLARVKEAVANAHVVRILVGALEDVMKERGIPLTDFGLDHLEWCEDAEKIRTFIRRAATAMTETDIFGDEPPLS